MSSIRQNFKVKIIYLNIEGLTSSKVEKLSKTFSDVDVLPLQETHISDKNKAPEDSWVQAD